MTAMHAIVGKSRLAAHIGEPHPQPGPRHRVAFEVTPLAERRRWSLEELRNAHRELHEGVITESEHRLLDGNR